MGRGVSLQHKFSHVRVTHLDRAGIHLHRISEEVLADTLA